MGKLPLIPYIYLFSILMDFQGELDKIAFDKMSYWHIMQHK